MDIKKALLALPLVCTAAVANELTSFKAITEQLALGKEIAVVVQNKLCQMNDPNPHKIPASTMVITPSASIFTDDFFSFDAAKFSASSYPPFSNGIMQRGSFRMDNAGKTAIVIAFFDAETNKKSADWKDVKTQCQLGDGIRVYLKK